MTLCPIPNCDRHAPYKIMAGRQVQLEVCARHAYEFACGMKLPLPPRLERYQSRLPASYEFVGGAP